MKPVNIKKLNRRDEVARRHRREFVLKIVIAVAGALFVVGGIIYILFFAQLFDVRDIGFNGLATIDSGEFQQKINTYLNQKILKYLPRRNNTFFIDTGRFEKEFSSAYPVFKSVDVQRKLLHGLVFNFSERKPAGIWCFDKDCSYFDNDKVLWGRPGKSSGFIFLTINDNRQTDKKEFADEFFKPIMEVAKNMLGEIKGITISEGSFNEFRVNTSGYYIIFSTDSDIQNQLDILKIFLDDKIKNSGPGGFHPQYIDLRIDGRVYYK